MSNRPPLDAAERQALDEMLEAGRTINEENRKAFDDFLARTSPFNPLAFRLRNELAIKDFIEKKHES